MQDLDYGDTIKGLKPGLKVFNRFVLKSLIGRGGMAQVWSADDEELGSVVALKFMREVIVTDKAALGELKREVRRSRELTHPHIVRVNDFHQQGQIAGISMELVEGDTLSNLRMDQPSEVFSPEQLAPWVAQLCQALDYAHNSVQVVHRDIKPSNLMLDGKGRLKITDFGIARSLTDSMSRLSNQSSAGTLLYMSPQQLRGEDPTPADDLYALGATLYELLTGRPPFKSGDIAGQIKGEIPVSPSQRRRESGLNGADLPAAWEQTILALLVKDPALRLNDAWAVLAGLGLKSEPMSQATATPARKTAALTSKETVRGGGFTKDRRKMPVWATITAAVLVGFGAIWYWGMYQPAQRAHEALMAQKEADRQEALRVANARGALAVTSNPTGAKALIAGVSETTTPGNFPSLKIGFHDVLFTKEGYASKSIQVKIEEGKVLSAPSVSLERLTGNLRIELDREGVQYQITGPDGYSRTGSSADRIERLPTGSYDIIFQQRGWADFVQKVTVDVNSESVIQYRPPSGVIEFRGPTDAMIDIAKGDGKLFEAIPLGRFRFECSPGEYQYAINRAGWPTQTGLVRIEDGVTKTFTPSFLTIVARVESAPSGAGISLYGRQLGKTPLQAEIPLGKIQLDGTFNDERVALTVVTTSNQSEPIRLVFPQAIVALQRAEQERQERERIHADQQRQAEARNIAQRQESLRLINSQRQQLVSELNELFGSGSGVTGHAESLKIRWRAEDYTVTLMVESYDDYQIMNPGSARAETYEFRVGIGLLKPLMISLTPNPGYDFKPTWVNVGSNGKTEKAVELINRLFQTYR